MYQLVSAIVKPMDGNGRWRGMDIGNVQLSDLFREFKRVVATLSNPVLPNPVSLDLEPLRNELGGSRMTFNVWLENNGNKTLPTSNEQIVINTRFAMFSDAVRSGYKVTPTHPTISPSSPLPVADKTDLLVTRAGADYQQIQRHVLANVNGFYHLTDWSTDGLFVVDGMKSCIHSGRNELGLLSFLNLGQLDFISIKKEMIYRHKESQKLRYNCYVDTGVDLSTKTVMLVLGGYLHVLDPRSFFRVSASAFGIDFGQIPLLDRYYESYRVLNLDELGLQKTAANDEQISVTDLFSDAVLTKYLTMSQSFFVVLDNQDIFLETMAVKQSPFPGCYTSFRQPIYPLVVGRGRHEVYWPRKEHDRYSINIRAAWRGHRNYDTINRKNHRSVSDAHLPVAGYSNSHAHFLLIGSDV